MKINEALALIEKMKKDIAEDNRIRLAHMRYALYKMILEKADPAADALFIADHLTDAEIAKRLKLILDIRIEENEECK